MPCRPSGVWLWVPVAKFQSPGKGKIVKTMLVTHHLKCENSMAKDQKAHTLQHVEVLKAQEKLLFLQVNMGMYKHPCWHISLYWAPTVYYGSHRAQAEFEILTLTLASYVTRTNYLTSLYLIFLTYKMGVILKAIPWVVMKFERGTVYKTFKIVHRTQVALQFLAFIVKYHALSWGQNRYKDR